MGHAVAAIGAKTARDPGATNIRNLTSPHWRRWPGSGAGSSASCLVPLTAFAEPIRGGNQWFAASQGAPMFFAGIETRGWISLRKVKEGETTDDLFGFLTCAPNSAEPNAAVRPVHPKAMPVILTRPAEWETWMSAPLEVAARLQRPLDDDTLMRIDAPA